MRFPLSLTRSMTSYLLRKRLAGERMFPLVLMLEPLHACNLRCAGCGRVREYPETMNQRLSVEQCIAAIEDCGAPIVSICGGEPLVYPEIETLVGEILARRKHIYLCTNGLLLRQKLSGFPRGERLMINVHLDGMEATHDAATCREGVFNEAVEGIRAAKRAGMVVCTNTTIYKQTNLDEIAVLFEYLMTLGVDGLMISPAYGYSSVAEDNPAAADEMFLNRREIHEKFRRARRMLSRFRLTTTPMYLDFLCGERELPCSAWANPTYNVRGWRSPCYLVADEHYQSYAELLERTDWSALGPGGDPRCRDCMVHCGFEPSAVLAKVRVRDILKMAVWQMT
jgi:hopanoid biosynthesis associated radical SAM protein HpnH